VRDCEITARSRSRVCVARRPSRLDQPAADRVAHDSTRRASRACAAGCRGGTRRVPWVSFCLSFSLSVEIARDPSVGVR
jgi:hypothetical protein